MNLIAFMLHMEQLSTFAEVSKYFLPADLLAFHAGCYAHSTVAIRLSVGHHYLRSSYITFYRATRMIKAWK